MAEHNTYNWELLPDGETSNSPLIKKIKLPSGNEYWIADAQARNIIGTDYDNNNTVNTRLGALEQAIAGGVSFIVAWDGASTPQPARIPLGVEVVYNNVTYTGTLAAGSATPGAFYLVHSDTQLDKDVYDEYVPVGDSTKTWEKIGDTQVDLSDVVTGVTLNQLTDVVLGESTTFTDPESTITVTGTQTDVVLGADTTFNVSGGVEFGEPPTIEVDPSGVTHNVVEPTITVTPSTTYLGALSNGTANGVTGYPNPSTNSFITSVDVEQGSKMVTDTITGTNGTDTATLISNKTDSNLVTVSITPTGGTDTATLITDKVDSKLVTDTIVGTNGTDTATLITNKTTGKLATTSIRGVTGYSNVSVIPSSTQQTTADGTVTTSNLNTDILMGASVTNEVLSLGACTLDTQTTNSANGATQIEVPRIAVSETTVATGAITTGSDFVTGFTTTDKTLAKVGTAKTFATGTLSSNGSGATLVQSFDTATKTLATVGTATTVATGTLSSNGSGATLVQSFSTATKTLAKAATTAKTFATGVLSTTGSGASVVTGVSITGSASAITGLGAPSTASFLTGVKLSSYTASATGRVQVATGISSAFASGTSVSHNISSKESVLTGMPTATFSTAVTVGTNDRVNAITNIGTLKDGSHAITVGTNDRVNALTSGTTLTVTKGTVPTRYNITVNGGSGDIIAYPESAASGDTVEIHNHNAFTTFSISTSPDVGSDTIGPDESTYITMPSENLFIYAVEV